MRWSRSLPNCISSLLTNDNSVEVKGGAVRACVNIVNSKWSSGASPALPSSVEGVSG